MTAGTEVTVRREVLEVYLTGTEADGLALQRRLTAVCADVVAPALEAGLSGFDPGDGHLRLDRLDVELTVSSLDELESALDTAVRRGVREHLCRAPTSQAAARLAIEPDGVRHRTSAETVHEALITFLHDGRLPWAFRLAPGRTLEQVVREAWDGGRAPGAPPSRSLSRLRAALSRPASRERLVRQFSPAFVLTVLRDLAPGTAAHVTAVEAAHERAGPASAAGRGFSRQLRMVALAAVAADREPSAGALIRGAWATHATHPGADPTLAAALERTWPGSTGPGTTAPDTLGGGRDVPPNTDGAPAAAPRASAMTGADGREARPSPAGATGTAGGVPESLLVDGAGAATADREPRADVPIRRPWAATHAKHPGSDPALAAALERTWPGSTGPGTAAPDTLGSGHDVPRGADGAPAAAPRASAMTRAGDREARPSPAGATGTAEEGSAGLLVDGAGVVLLHPFLPRFFGALGVAGDGGLTDPDRALALLDHLATGEPTAPEHRVTLFKVLCGLPPDRPVEADAGLTDDETAEATALLETAIRHWEALRGTSAGALRAEFLQRPGVLEETFDGDWLLRVETRTLDILLDRLPWAISPLRLPWMDRMMMVEWR